MLILGGCMSGKAFELIQVTAFVVTQFHLALFPWASKLHSAVVVIRYAWSMRLDVDE
jgi:hypothetical protein